MIEPFQLADHRYKLISHGNPSPPVFKKGDKSSLITTSHAVEKDMVTLKSTFNLYSSDLDETLSVNQKTVFQLIDLSPNPEGQGTSPSLLGELYFAHQALILGTIVVYIQTEEKYRHFIPSRFSNLFECYHRHTPRND